MDSVRFGRALGFGARAAAKTLVTAVDAATSPNPSASSTTSSPSKTAPPPTSAAAAAGARAAQKTAQTASQIRQTAAQVHQTGEGLKRGGKRFGEAVWGPTVRLSGILWLEVTGVFFGIFALFAVGGVWRLRGALHGTAANQEAHSHFLGAVAMAVVFGYFCISSFVTASRRGRQR